MYFFETLFKVLTNFYNLKSILILVGSFIFNEPDIEVYIYNLLLHYYSEIIIWNILLDFFVISLNIGSTESLSENLVIYLKIHSSTKKKKSSHHIHMRNREINLVV